MLPAAGLVLAYHADQLFSALPEEAEVELVQQAEARAARLNAHFFRTGSPVPRGWRPRPEKLSAAHRGKRSVARRVEEEAFADATITYILPAMTSHFVRFGRHRQPAELRLHRVAQDQTPPAEGEQDPLWVAARAVAVDAPAAVEPPAAWAAAEALARDQVKVEADGMNQIASEERARKYIAGEDHKRPAELERLTACPDGGCKTGISRCGFSWDDAAVKMGDWCFSVVSTCIVPPGTDDNPDSYWFGANYSCYADLPDIGVRGGGRGCRSTTEAVTDAWCTQFCNTADTYCDPIFCDCTDRGTGLEDMAPFKVTSAFNVSAPIQPPRDMVALNELPHRTAALVAEVAQLYDDQPSGLPNCLWRPAQECANGYTSGPNASVAHNARVKVKQYECLRGKHSGECSDANWFEQPEACKSSCVHSSLLPLAPYYALWYPGPLAKEFHPDEQQPRYKHDPERFSLHARNINLQKTDVLMSDMCKSSDNQFVGISLYSPHYKAKAERLLRSCARVGVCCKATLLPSDAFGPSAPEGSEAFRFETIASKPSFMLSELKSTGLPVVFLDTDLEFHSFPHLFVAGSWPNGGRDLAIFNFWGNETDWKHASRTATGSGVVFVNQTQRAHAVLTAWAEAMASEGNTNAPDDQVLDKLLSEDGWLSRASFGWLPASYMRTMPAYYNGVAPVIEHDHGSAPGLLKHSEAKPRLPKVLYTEPSDPCPEGSAACVHEAAPLPSKYEDLAEVVTPPQPDNDFQMPTGTCVATGSLGDADDDTQYNNNLWCDRSCVPIPWGGLGQTACSEGHEETGHLNCICEQGVAPVLVKGGKAPSLVWPPKPPPSPPRQPLGNELDEMGDLMAARRAGEQELSSKRGQQAQQSSEAHRANPSGKCEATSALLPPSAKLEWGVWCEQQCRPPTGLPENCETPEMTGAAECVC